MKIPYRDAGDGVKRCWTDHERIAKRRFDRLYETIEECSEIKRVELIKLRELLDEKLQACASQ